MKQIKNSRWMVKINFAWSDGFYWIANNESGESGICYLTMVGLKKTREQAKIDWEKFAGINQIKKRNWKYDKAS